MRGKAPINRHQAEEHGVTPRVREKCGYRLPSRSIVGSPPTVRGKERLAKNQRSVHGITPRMRGKEKFAMAADMKLGSPRVCGEKIISMLKASFGAGSPRVCGEKAQRQKRTSDGKGSPRVRVFGGITPAYAGLTIKSRALIPPRMRGKVRRLRNGNGDHPAYAGKI